MKTLIKLELKESDGKVELKFDTGSGAPLNSENLTKIINILGNLRQQFKPSVSEVPPKIGDQVPSVIAPFWQVSPEPLVGGALIQFRHPAFGWLGFGVPNDSLKHLAEGLARIIPVVDEAERSRSMN
ncbi:hypothetical protein PTE30175_01846 [Pandoraea terrae]|uniref:Uncharacterized protein n=1 Tax=Pandoraea terrae TaxID=1537710 RepID=A0A5E4UAF9_9BURK|nr:hypothetical protein [Pandoraea terrae]VVD96781.1 hypothetical protein PTE30175_01846 [Pandoraea terrae]